MLNHITRHENGDEDNFSQATLFYNKTLKEDEKKRLIENIAGNLKDAADFLQVFNLIASDYLNNICIACIISLYDNRLFQYFRNCFLFRKEQLKTLQE